jgi:tetratricopeptide (TPR) repeat protein
VRDLSSFLRLSCRASGEDIRAAYWALSREFHPDVNAGDKEGERRIKEINRAYGILGDPDARAAYNLILARAHARARRRFWRAAATGAAAFILTVGSISVIVWKQHADIHHSSDKPGFLTRLATSNWSFAKPPVEKRGLADSKKGAPPSASPEITSTALRDSEAQTPGVPAVRSSLMLERPTSEEYRSAATSELSTTVRLAVGKRAPQAPGSLNGLALLCRDLGRYAEAEPLFKRALAIREKVLGPDHLDVGQSLTNLGDIYRCRGRYGEAEPLLIRGLAIREKALGPNHPAVGISLNDLALVYHGQGRYAEAERLYERAIAIYEKAFGPDHREVGTCLDNLARLYRAQGRYAEVEPLYKRAIAIYEKALGPDHREISVRLNNLAELYRMQGRYAEAEPLHKRALAIREKAGAVFGNVGAADK